MKMHVDTASDLQDVPHERIKSIGYYAVMFGLPIMVIIIGINFWVGQKSEEARKWVTHTYEVQVALSLVLSTLQDAETGQRGYLLTGDVDYLEPYLVAISQLDGIVAGVQKLTLDNPKQQQWLKQAAFLIDGKLKELDETVMLKKKQGQESAISIVNTGKGKRIMDELRSLISVMQAEENSLLTERNQILYKNELLARSIEFVGFILIILIGIFAFTRTRALLVMQSEAEEKLRHMANHDLLTGLATRRLGIEYISFALAEARRHKSKAAVLFIDLDGFKAINDTLGHDAGDCLLRGVAERLSHCVREVDLVVRVGGDEFMIVMTSINSREDIARIAQKVINALARPFQLADENASIGASIGIALYPDHEQEPDALVKRADVTMYEVKGRGKNHFAFAADE